MCRVDILKASTYLEKDYNTFSYIISKAYEITEGTDKDYKDRFLWYWKKVLPGVLDGTRDVFLVKSNSGCAVLKKEDSERKICTLFVLDEYRGMGIATALLEEAFKYLGTTTPLITIPEYRVEQFIPIIKKYGWRKTQILKKGYYSNLSREFVFNGKIS